MAVSWAARMNAARISKRGEAVLVWVPAVVMVGEAAASVGGLSGWGTKGLLWCGLSGAEDAYEDAAVGDEAGISLASSRHDAEDTRDEATRRGEINVVLCICFASLTAVCATSSSHAKECKFERT